MRVAPTGSSLTADRKWGCRWALHRGGGESGPARPFPVLPARSGASAAAGTPPSPPPASR